MNKKAVKSVISKKFKEFINSIEDGEVQSAIANDSIITGGAIASLLLNEKINDFDIYFTNPDTAFKAAMYFAGKYNAEHSSDHPVSITNTEGRVKCFIQSAGVAGEEIDDNQYEYSETITEEESTKIIDFLDGNKESTPPQKKYRPIFFSSNAITLSDHIQIVLRFTGNADEIHKNFDFIHCTNYWVSADNRLELNQRALESLLSKHLFYCGSLYPVSSVIRARKFIERGWHINAGQYVKMCMQVSELNMRDVDVLQEQLTGVDVTYFNKIINQLALQKENDPSFEYSLEYVTEILDRIF